MATGHLVLTRRTGQLILIGDDIVIEVVRIRGGLVRIGVAAPVDLKVLRSELQTQGLRNEADETSPAGQHGEGQQGTPSRKEKAAGLAAQVQAVARRRREASEAAGTSEACPARATAGGDGGGQGSREQAA